eukprot:463467-Hanusia_phi.AAC.1
MLERKQEGEGLSHVSQANKAEAKGQIKKEIPNGKQTKEQATVVDTPNSRRLKEVLSQVGSLLTRV